MPVIENLAPSQKKTKFVHRFLETYSCHNYMKVRRLHDQTWTVTRVAVTPATLLYLPALWHAPYFAEVMQLTFSSDLD